MDLRGVDGLDLEAVYQEFFTDHDFAPSMLEILTLLRQRPWDGIVYALFSHAALVLLSTDDYAGHRWVEIDPWRRSGVEVLYRLPRSEAPWVEARCGGVADTPARAVEMALIGMRLSRGWALDADTQPDLGTKSE